MRRFCSLSRRFNEGSIATSEGIDTSTAANPSFKIELNARSVSTLSKLGISGQDAEELILKLLNFIIKYLNGQYIQ
jgi:hypothetical protein